MWVGRGREVRCGLDEEGKVRCGLDEEGRLGVGWTRKEG